MKSHTLFLTAGAVFHGALAVPVDSGNGLAILSDANRAYSRVIFPGDSIVLDKRADSYSLFTGKATQGSWPSADLWWKSFENMFQKNVPLMRIGCEQFGVAKNSDEELIDLYKAIKQVSSETKVDNRFILAVLLQESAGCVRAPTSNFGVRNPGIMQSHSGRFSCNDYGNALVPCPAISILSMVRDGVAGTAAGDSLVQLLRKAPGKGAMRFYNAARMYNSGSIDPSGKLEDGVASRCYASDVANRMIGWVTVQKKCTLDGPPPPGFAAAKDVQFSLLAPGTNVETPVLVGVPIHVPVSSAHTPEPTFTSPSRPLPPVIKSLPEPSPTSTTSAPPTPTATHSDRRAPGVPDNCLLYYTVLPGDFCWKAAGRSGITLEELLKLNPSLNADCSNLWLGYDYCVRGPQ